MVDVFSESIDKDQLPPDQPPESPPPERAQSKQRRLSIKDRVSDRRAHNAHKSL